jgi:hypothetical protein
MRRKKIFKVKIVYINEKLSKKPQIITAEVKGHPKNLQKKITVQRKVAHENFVQTFNLNNYRQIKELSII